MTTCRRRIRPEFLRARKEGYTKYTGNIEECGKPAITEIDGESLCGIHAHWTRAQKAKPDLRQIDTQKLRALAQWLDLKFPRDVDPQVQNDLRRWADIIDEYRA